MNGIVVYENRIHKHIMEELPFMATEYIIMEEVKAGGPTGNSRSDTRSFYGSLEKVKMEGKENDLIERIMNDDSLKLDKSKLKEVLDPKISSASHLSKPRNLFSKKFNLFWKNTPT